jgi:beta-galactosidase/beta-glucuronidase
MQKRYFIDPEHVLEEYPRPQMVRSSYTCLNGSWEFAIRKDTVFPTLYPYTILVPFSPQTELSGLQKSIGSDEVMTYRRTFSYPALPDGHHLILHFTAVDHQCTVFVNGYIVGSHRGGYLPFSFDITKYVKKTGNNELIVQVRDPGDTEPIIRGKQSKKNTGIYYSGQSGIYQTVWLEQVPENYIHELIITANLPQQCWYVTVVSTSNNQEVTISFLDGQKKTKGLVGQRLCCQVLHPRAWTVEDPYLYHFTVEMGEDVVQSYVGLRSFGVSDGMLLLNGKPYFHHGVLDQGYWPHSLYTPVCGQAMLDDIKLIKKLGFNMVRKHQKVESLRWYHHCDTQGLLVWQDMVRGGRNPIQPIMSGPLLFSDLSIKDHHYSLLGSQDEQYREDYEMELRAMIKTLYNCTSIAMWVLFNEGWGQFDAKRHLEMVKTLDSTRTIDPTSGWYDQGIGDFKSVHTYFKPFSMQGDRYGRATLLSEFGGIVFNQPNCAEVGQKPFGYAQVKTREDFNEAFFSLYSTQVYPAKKKGLSASVYTQLTDVEQETNGLITFDRLYLKLDESVALQVAALLFIEKSPEDVDSKEVIREQQNQDRCRSNQTKI